MRSRLYAACLVLLILASGKTVSACSMAAERRIEDIKLASVVVVGRITNYEIVLDQAARQKRKEELARHDWPPKVRALLSGQTRFLSDYARFNVLVDEVLAGKSPAVLTVTWNNSTFGEPDKIEEGPFLIALRYANGDTPPLRAPSATILPAPEPGLTVLQAPCAEPLMFPIKTREAKRARRILARGAR